MVMASGKDGLLKRGVRGYIDMALVSEDLLSILPVGQTRVEGRGNGSIY